MTSPPKPLRPHAGRKATDESLRAERKITDAALGKQVTATEVSADALVARERQQADAALTSSRARRDHQDSSRGQSARAGSSIQQERRREDVALQEQRDQNDEVLRDERAQQSKRFDHERQATDKDLLTERADADADLATREDLMGIVAHDLRGMLSSVLGFAALIAQEEPVGDSGPRIRSHALRIQRSGARMSRLVNDLVDIASIEAGKLSVTPEVNDPSKVILEAIDSFQTQAQASAVTLQAGPLTSAPPASFDAARILQVLGNLIGNALKFTPRGGRVEVQVEQRDTLLHFSVQDTGMGIPPDKVEGVFARFAQLSGTDHRGSGLGLYIAQCIIEAHGGRIWAESQVGQGSTFCFDLPVRAAS